MSSSASDRFNCPHCLVFAHHARASLKIMYSDMNNNLVPMLLSDDEDVFEPLGRDILPTMENGGGDWDNFSNSAQWWSSLCASCKRIAVWRHSELVFPSVSLSVPAPHPDMPDSVSVLYREAAAVLPASRRAAAALARAALESLLKELDDENGRKNLQTRVGELRGRINQTLWQVLTALRVVGNDSLHGENDELVAVYLNSEDAEMAETFFGALNALVEELVTQPRKAADLYSLIPAAKREAAERTAQR